MSHDGRNLPNDAMIAAREVARVGRKNWLFVGSKKGGRHAAILRNMIASAKRCGVAP